MELVHATYQNDNQQKYAKRLFKKESFDLIHMHMKKDETISTHHAPTEVIIIVRAGEVEFNIEDTLTTLTKEDILYLDPYEDHSMRAIEETDLILLKVKS